MNKRKNNFPILALMLYWIVSTTSVLGNVRLPSILSSHMVLQQKSEIKFWGWSDANEAIIIKTGWDTVVYKSIGSRDGKWTVKIKTPQAGGSYKITINNIVLDDVLIGEVWLCSGQSNMEWNINAIGEVSEDEKISANNPSIRFFHVLKTTSDYPQDNVMGQWIVCSPEEFKYFSAVGYFFAKKIQHELKLPVGMISSNWVGTAAETWTPKELVDKDIVLKKNSVKVLSSFPGWPVTPGKTYNAMIYPIVNFSIAGVLWYQGESNVVAYDSYQYLFSTMINAWRTAWNQVLPFYFVQIAPFNYENKNVGALLREAQTKSLNLPLTGMIVISDLVDNINDIHPKNKASVGLRLANYALAERYEKKEIAYKSPIYKSMKVDKDRIRVSFYYAEKGLMSKGDNVTEFYIAGEDKNFFPADAKIIGNEVVVKNRNIKNPVAVRFGFSNTSIPNLFSKDGLPVNLFRTDNWELNTNIKE